MGNGRGMAGCLAALALLGMAATPGSARTWLVDDDRAEGPTADFTSIEAAVNAAASGDTIRLLPGLYRENLTVTNKSLTFQGDGSDRVIVDGNPGEPAGSAPSFVNVFTLRATSGQAFIARFMGLTIRRGRYGILAQDTETGGGRVGSRMTVDVSRCVFVRNGYDGIPYATPGSTVSSDYTAHATDGGALRGEGDESRVVECQFVANDRAVQFDFGRGLVITGNQIGENVQAGISMGRRLSRGEAAVVSNVTIRGNRVYANFDAGIRISGGAQVTVEGNVIERNWNSGIVAYDSSGVLINQNRVFENGLLDINGLGSFTPDGFGGIAIIDPVGVSTLSNNHISGNHPGLFTHTAAGVRIVKSTNLAVTLNGNTVMANDGDGVAVEGSGANLRINGNNITSNRAFGVNNLSGVAVDAARNWWGSARGPRVGAATADNPEQVSGRLVTSPFATAPFAYPEIRLTTSP
jgi:parallel beta-helix repeat protein